MCSRRFPLFALSLFLALLLVPSRAFALDIIPKGVIYQGDVQGSNYGAVVSAYNQYDAACYVLGKDPNTISSTIKAKLSDSNYGGRFYEYAQSFFTQSGGLEDMPEWVPTYIFWGSEFMDLVLADYQAVWYSTTTKALHDAALVDFARILNGEDLGGGGSGGVNVSGFYEMVSSNHVMSGGISDYVATARAAHIDSDGNLVLDSGTMSYSDVIGNGVYVDSVRAYVSPGVVDFIQQNYSSLDYSFFVGMRYRTGEVRADIVIASELTVSRRGSDGNARDCVYNTQPSVNCGAVVPAYFDSEGVFIVLDDSFLNNGFNALASRYQDPSYYSVPAPVTSVPAAPDGDWPEPAPTPAPTAPDLPDPVQPTVTPDPVVTEPTPTWPDVNITVNPPAVIVPETPEGLDYTALLTLINDNLESIDAYIVAINSTLNSLRSDLVTEFDGVVQSLRNIYSYLQHMDSVLERHCIHLQNKMEDVSTDIQNKMRELVHWLAEQLDFDSESSGNSDLFGILSTISDKLGGGTYEPNPIRDELGYYEWLDNLWDRFLLGENWQASAGSISQSFGQLTSRFPFSVPWDIVALFRLFVHDPVTPVFDLPLYYSADDYATVHVDLSGWDGVAAVVRPLVFVIFALNLALLSRHLLAGFGADKGGL